VVLPSRLCGGGCCTVDVVRSEGLHVGECPEWTGAERGAGGDGLVLVPADHRLGDGVVISVAD
jgi:hypothetical protein